MRNTAPSASASRLVSLQTDVERGATDSPLRRLFEANVIGILIARNSGEIVEANDAFLAMIGYSRDDLVEGRVDWRSLTPPEWLALDETAIALLATNGAFTPYEKEYLRKDGTRVPIAVGGARIAETGDEQICYIVDLSERRAAELALQQSERRYRSLAEALPHIVMLADEERGLLYVNQHYEAVTGIPAAELGQRWREPIHPDDLAVIDRARATGASYEVEYRLRRASDGAYRWYFARCLKISGDGSRAEWLAAAVDIDDRKRAEESLQFIERAGSLLSQTLDLQTTFETLLDLVVPDVGDWALISLRDEDGTIRTVAARHKDAEKAGIARSICGEHCYRNTGTWGTPAVYETGTPQLVSHITIDDLIALVNDQHIAAFCELGFGSVVSLPIYFGGVVIGSFSIATAGDMRIYTTADLPPLQELARRAGVAIGNAREYEREHRVSNVFQAAALPRALPIVDGLRFDAYYQAGRQEALVGGDWFDAVVLGDGRVLVAVGDVCGNGLKAAVQMSNVRQVMRGVAHIDADPLTLLDVADRALRDEYPDSIVTAFVGIIDPRRQTFHYASAGHPPALLRSPDGVVVELTTRGLPLGLRDLAPCASATQQILPGSSLLLYTDGLIEWSHDILAGEALLRQRFADAFDPHAEHPAGALVTGIFRGELARDDVAALSVAFDAA